MTENRSWGCLDLIFRKTVDIWTQRRHQGRLISESETSWVIDGPNVWLFENASPNMILR
jgi:hypothetical protein